jgi:PAS domain S-box-containing protein
MALDLHPDTTRLAVVSDQVVSGQMHLQDIARLLERHESRGMQIVRLVDLEADQLARRLSGLPDQTLVLYLSLFQSADGRRFDWSQGVGFVDRHCDRPIYTFWGFAIGYGAVGGVITSGSDQGSQAAEMMLDILQGTGPEQISIQRSNPKRIVFDAEKLAEAGLTIDDLPPKARVIRRKISFYQRYRSLIWMVGTILMVLVVLLAAVSINVLHRRRAEKQLRTERNLLQNVLANIPHMVFWKDENLIYRGCNLNYARFAGFEQPEQLIGKSDADLPIPPQRRARYQAQDRHVLRTGEPILEQTERLYDTNGDRQIVIIKVPLRSRQGRMEGVLCLCRDVTRQRMLEQQLQHAEKMEAVGQLAGGIAHDFNNLLAVIQGNVELMRMQMEDGHPNAPLAEEVLNATRRAAELTRQLLNFARRGEMKLQPLDVNIAVAEVAEILSRSLIGQIEVRTDLQAEPSVIQADESQLHNALLNLGLNARDAMAEGGTLTFRTRTVELSEQQVEQLGSSAIRPGRYLQLEVTDTGAGMDAETVERAFEPFFTTKQMGHGTGLGLASVYGAVVAHRGHVQIESSPGHGTTITMLLPIPPNRAGDAEGQADAVSAEREAS